MRIRCGSEDLTDQIGYWPTGLPCSPYWHVPYAKRRRNLSHKASSRICMDRRSRLQFRASVLDSWHIEFFPLSLSLSLNLRVTKPTMPARIVSWLRRRSLPLTSCPRPPQKTYVKRAAARPAGSRYSMPPTRVPFPFISFRFF